MTDVQRPRSILGLLVRLLELRPRLALGLLGLVLATAAAGSRACPEPAVDVATFNIEKFPKSERQIAGAFQAIAELDVPIVAVQEITDPLRFSAEAVAQLGPQWKAEFGPYLRRRDNAAKSLLLPGVLYDRTRYQLDYARRHHQTRVVIPGEDGARVRVGRPTLEVRLFSREGGPTLRVFVVHLKSNGKSASVRLAQLRALTPIVRRAARSRDEVVVLGDFNTTGPADFEALARFAADTGLHWASESLACTAYWKPAPKRTCSGSALDHVFTSRAPRSIAARGPCESVGCEPGDSCPVFYDEVSDHCPVSAAF